MQKTKKEEIIDEAAKARFNGAQTVSQKLEVMKSELEKMMQTYEEAIRKDEEQIGTLCLRYSQLALSGSFTGVILSTIRVLKYRLEDMKRKGQSQDAQDKMASNIAMLDKKLQVIRAVEKRRDASDSIPKRLGGLAQSVVKGLLGA